MTVWEWITLAVGAWFVLSAVILVVCLLRAPELPWHE